MRLHKTNSLVSDLLHASIFILWSVPTTVHNSDRTLLELLLDIQVSLTQLLSHKTIDRTTSFPIPAKIRHYFSLSFLSSKSIITTPSSLPQCRSCDFSTFIFFDFKRKGEQLHIFLSSSSFSIPPGHQNRVLQAEVGPHRVTVF